jgi:hypothetical protein
VDTLRAEAGRAAWYRAFAALFATHDFLVAPAAQLFLRFARELAA